jgi:glutamate dehydrogenase (NADP+)
MMQWSFADVDQRLQIIMKDIYQRCAETAIEFHQPCNLMLGANIAGFRKVADAMLEQGLV